MSGISESMLWLIIGKGIRNDLGNGQVVGIDKIMVSLIELASNDIIPCYVWAGVNQAHYRTVALQAKGT